MTRDSVRRALRTFIITTLALFVPGVLGFLNEITEWARGEGEVPFPDGRGLVFLGVSALVAGVVAAINLVWNVVEDASGHGLLRSVPDRPVRGETGALTRGDAIIIGFSAIIVLAIIVAIAGR